MGRIVASVLFTLFAATASAADAPFRCGGKIIDRGMSVGEVLALWGEPDLHWRRDVPARARNPAGFTYWSGVTVNERLIYERGYGRFPVELEFIEGELRRTELLTRAR